MLQLMNDDLKMGGCFCLQRFPRNNKTERNKNGSSLLSVFLMPLFKILKKFLEFFHDSTQTLLCQRIHL